jgi:hypothetical protein
MSEDLSQTAHEAFEKYKKDTAKATAATNGIRLNLTENYIKSVRAVLGDNPDYTKLHEEDTMEKFAEAVDKGLDELTAKYAKTTEELVNPQNCSQEQWQDTH